MALLETNDTIRAYYEIVKDKYPDIPYSQFEAICKNPFRFFKNKIETDSMPIIAIKYFGKFKVYPSKIKTIIKELNIKKKFGTISEERYNKIKGDLEQRLKILNQEDNAQLHSKSQD